MACCLHLAISFTEEKTTKNILTLLLREPPYQKSIIVQSSSALPLQNIVSVKQSLSGNSREVNADPNSKCLPLRLMLLYRATIFVEEKLRKALLKECYTTKVGHALIIIIICSLFSAKTWKMWRKKRSSYYVLP